MQKSNSASAAGAAAAATERAAQSPAAGSCGPRRENGAKRSETSKIITRWESHPAAGQRHNPGTRSWPTWKQADGRLQGRSTREPGSRQVSLPVRSSYPATEPPLGSPTPQPFSAGCSQPGTRSSVPPSLRRLPSGVTLQLWLAQSPATAWKRFPVRRDRAEAKPVPGAY